MNKDFNWDEIKKVEPKLCNDCGSLKEAIKQCGDLEQLFALWKAAHKHEKDAGANADDYKKSTFPDLKKYKGIDIETQYCNCRMENLRENISTNFCRDGFIRGNERECDKFTILFVFREPNISEDIKADENNCIRLTSQDKFWLYEEYQKGLSQGSNNIYLNFIRQYMNELKIDRDKVRIAVVNLNKRGGFGECNYSRLQHYVAKYKAFIQKEIEIIAPSVIICGGTFGTVKDLLTDGSKNVEVWDCYHPSFKGNKDADSVKKWTCLEIMESHFT